MIVYESKIFKLPVMKNYAGITLAPNLILFQASKENVSDRLIRHELCHAQQMRRYGIFKFYVLYIAYYFAGLIKYKNHWDAYRSIPFEIEAEEAEIAIV